MPKAPITSRTWLYELLDDGSLSPVPFNLVSTSLGQMVEWKVITLRPGDSIQNADEVDMSFSDLLRVTQGTPTGNYALDQLLLNGSQWPHYRTYDPGVK